MSGVSPFHKSDLRPLTQSEHVLIDALLAMIPEGHILRAHLQDARVEAMQDGGMGSLLFAGNGSDRKAREAVVVQSVDEDGVPLSISLNLDQNSELFELDIWKVDFSPLRSLPGPEKVKRV